MNAITAQPSIKSSRGPIDDDVYRIYGRTGFASTLKALLARPPFRAIFTMRICQAVATAPRPIKLLLPICTLLHGLMRRSASMDFPWQVSVGRGLAIDHGWGLVVNGGARLGDNVTLYHGVTLGRSDRIDRNGQRRIGYPVIDDEVWIGPHAVIVGAVHVGRGSRIAAGAFVTKDVPPNSLVVGNPGKVVKTGCVPDILNAVGTVASIQCDLEASAHAE